MISKNRRLGTFQISLETINKRPWSVSLIMSQCIIVRAECHWAHNTMEYVAISRHFDEIGHGEMAPEYQWTLFDDGDFRVQKIAQSKT